MLRAGVAFLKLSGVQHIAQALRQFVEDGGAVRMTVGVDCRGTSFEGLRALLDAIQDHGEIWVFHNETDSTFHPKVFLFSSDQAAHVYVGSGNLTEGGLFTNYEAGLRVELDLTTPSDREIYDELVRELESWTEERSGTAHRLSDLMLARLVALGYVPLEREAAETEEEPTGTRRGARQGGQGEKLFAAVGVKPAPKRPATQVREARRRRARATGDREAAEAPAPAPVGFVMILQQTDVGTGQTTKGTSRRSPEVFIPLAARDAAPAFWDYPDKFVEDKTHEGKMDRHGVRVRIGGQVVNVNMMTWPDKHDFRLRSEALRSAGQVGDILRVERAPRRSGFDYYAEVIPTGTWQFDRFAALCTTPVRDSKKRFGYY